MVPVMVIVYAVFDVAPAVAAMNRVRLCEPPLEMLALLLTVTELVPEKLAVTPCPAGETETPLVTIPAKLPAVEVSVMVTVTLVATPFSTFAEIGEALTVNFFVAAGAKWGSANTAAMLTTARRI